MSRARMHRSLPLIAILLSVLKAGAQSPSPSTPVPPGGSLLNRAPEFARWTVECKPLAEAADPKATPPPSEPEARRKRKKRDPENPGQTTDAHSDAPILGSLVRTTVTKTGSIFHLQTTGKSGDAEEKWCLPDLQVTLRPDATEPLISVPDHSLDTAYVDFAKSDFPDCAWVSRADYAGLEQYDNRSCLVFKGHIAAQSVGGTPEQDGLRWIPATAYVDYYSRLPVALIWGGMVQTYRYEMPPPELQTIPGNVADAMKRHEQKIKALSLKPAKPY